MIVRNDIPKEVQNVADSLENSGFEAYLVGGCVRDLMLSKTPKDWDITTNAKPEEILEIFSHAYSNNDYGTVGVVNEEVEEEALKVVEVTPYRSESGYSDKRRPDAVEFGVSLEEDLKRRDFTVNAMAYNLDQEKLIDIYGGEDDLEKKRLKTVGEARDRFSEDALRMLRAVRLATELNFAIEAETMAAIVENHELLSHISSERIRDEWVKVLLSDTPMQGMVFLEKLGLIDYIIPEIKEGIECHQGGAHDYDVYEHLLKTLQAAADKEYPLEMRLAALLHDIGKPKTRREGGKNKKYTFYGHEVVGAKMTKTILNRLKFPKDTVEKVEKLVRWHMFFSDPEEITLSAVRRTIARIGEENIKDLLNLRVCDRLGTGRPKEKPFRLRKYEAMVDEAMRDPVSVKMLKISGDKIMEITGEKPGKKVGYLLHALLEEVLTDPGKNEESALTERVLELNKLPEEDLKEMAEAGKKKQEEEEQEALKAIAREHKVG